MAEGRDSRPGILLRPKLPGRGPGEGRIQNPSADGLIC